MRLRSVAPVCPTAALPLDELDLMLLKGVADTTTLAGAARAAGISRAVATRRLSTLEQRVAAVLLRHDAGRARITPAGRRVLAAGSAFVSAVVATAARVADAMAGQPVGLPRLRLAGFGGNWSGVADDLSIRVPGMVLELTTDEPAHAATRYDEYEVDAIYAWQAAGQPVEVSRPAAVVAVLDEPLWVALPASHRCAHGGPIPLRALAADHWIVGQHARQLTHLVCADEGFAPRVVAVAESVATARSLVSHAVGVCLVSPLTVAPCRDAGLVLAPLRDGPRRRHVLVFDPTTVNERLARIVAARLRHSYVATAIQRNPRYRPDPTPHDEPPFHPSLLAGLRPADGRSGTPRIGLDDLRVLRVVASAGSLNRAARVLLISQPALSRRIHRLERALGMRLFVRTHRGTTLAPAAHELLAEIAPAQAALRAVLESVNAPAARWRRTAGA